MEQEGLCLSWHMVLSHGILNPVFLSVFLPSSVPGCLSALASQAQPTPMQIPWRYKTGHSAQDTPSLPGANLISNQLLMSLIGR